MTRRPAFPNYKTAKTVLLGSSDLLVPSGRSCPLVWDIDGDGKKDLLSGNTDGQICLYLNTGTDAEPNFDVMQSLKADDLPINIGSQRSRICLADLNNDGISRASLGWRGWHGSVLPTKASFNVGDPIQSLRRLRQCVFHGNCWRQRTEYFDRFHRKPCRTGAMAFFPYHEQSHCIHNRNPGNGHRSAAIFPRKIHPLIGIW